MFCVPGMQVGHSLLLSRAKHMKDPMKPSDAANSVAKSAAKKECPMCLPDVLPRPAPSGHPAPLLLLLCPTWPVF
jgi:hypothetical protein